MAQLGNTYTGKLADIPTYLTRNHLYYAYDSQQLYSFNPDGTPYLLAPIFGDGSTTESDPIFKAHVVYNITQLDIDNWNDAFSWGDHSIVGYLTEVDVVNLNLAPETKNIATVDGKFIKETVTQLNQPELIGNELYLKYLKEDGVEQSVMIDLSSIVLPNDGSGAAISAVDYYPETNIISIDEDNGAHWEVDLSEFSIIASTDEATGITTITQENEIKFTISQVGQTGDYNHLINKPDLDFHTKFEIFKFFEGADNAYYLDGDGDPVYSTVYQPNNWNFAWRWTTNFKVTNENTNTNTRNIGIVSYGANTGNPTIFNIKESITTLSNLRLENDTWLHVTYINETGTSSDISVDLANLIPAIDSEIRIQNAAWDETLDQIVITETDGQQWHITLPEFLREVEVISNNPQGVVIGTVDGKPLHETLTKLEIVGLSEETHILTVTYTNEEGEIHRNEIDFSRFLTSVDTEIRIESAYWGVDDSDPENPVETIVIEETDGKLHYVTDFPSFVDYTVSKIDNEDGSYDVEQNGEVKFTVPKAYTGFRIENPNGSEQFFVDDYLRFEGVTFNPEEKLISVDDAFLPDGLEGQVYYIHTDGTNDVEPDFLLQRGVVVENEEEYYEVATRNFTLQEVHESWRMFAHYFNDASGMEAEQSPPSFPALNPTEPDENERLTQAEFDSRIAWEYNAAGNYIICSKNYLPYTGFISPIKYGNYTLDAKISSPNGDDDWIGLVMGFHVDPITKFEYTLSVFRKLRQDTNNPSVPSYIVYYNFGQTRMEHTFHNPLYDDSSEEVIMDASNLAPWPAPPTNNAWEAGNHTRLRIERSRDTFTITTSQFGSYELDDSTTITINLNDYPKLSKFKYASEVGFSAASQKNAIFSDVYFTGLQDNIFVPLPLGDGPYTSYDVYEYDADLGQYPPFGSPQNEIVAAQYFGKGRFVHTEYFNRTYYIDQNDNWIKISGLTNREVLEIINNEVIIPDPQDTGVMSIEGDGVDNTDPKNPVISWPDIPPEIDQDNKIRMIYLYEEDLPLNYTVYDVAALITSMGLTIGDKEIIAWEVIPDSYVELGYLVDNNYARKTKL